MARKKASTQNPPESLQDPQDLYRVLFENVPDIVFTMDPEGKLGALNAAFETTLGWKRDDWIGQAFASLIHPDDLKAAAAHLRRHLTGENPSEAELRIRTRSGDYRVIEVRASPFHAAGRVIGVLGIGRDITDRKRAYEAQDRLAALVSSSDDAIVGYTLDGIVSSWNGGAERIFGYPREDIVGRPVRLLLPDDHASETTQILERIRRGQVVDHFETTRIRKDGRRIQVSLSVSPIRDGKGVVVGAASIARDITERLRRQRERAGLFAVSQAATQTMGVEELGESVAKSLAEALHYHSVLLYLAYPEERRLRIAAQYGLSPRAHQTMGSYPMDPAAPFVAVRTYFSREPQIVDNLQERDDLSHVIDYIQEQGLEALLSIPIQAGRECLGVLQAVTSIRPREVQEEVRVLQVVATTLALAIHQKQLFNRLTTTVHELDAFVYTVSHDLAEPLRTITNFSRLTLAEHGDQITSEVKDYLERVYRGARRMRGMLEALLKYSRLERSPEPESEISVPALIDEIREALAATLNERNAHVLVEGHLPLLRTQRTRLAEVFTNLIANGIKFNDKPRPQVRVGCRGGDGFYEFWVEDNGIGIPPEYRSKLFRLFTRLHPQDAYPGNGAGLAIVARCVSQMGGRIWVESVVGTGSRFWFTVPVQPPIVGADAYATPSAAAENPSR